MRTKLTFNGKPTLQLVYEGNEWETVSQVLENNLKLKLSTTTNLFGNHVTGKYYRDTDENLKRFIDRTLVQQKGRGVNDINTPVIVGENTVNIAILRVVPTDGVVEVPMQKFMNIAELQSFVRTLARTMEFLFSIVVEKEIKMHLREAGE